MYSESKNEINRSNHLADKIKKKTHKLQINNKMNRLPLFTPFFNQLKNLIYKGTEV